jgi:hypothetical protein
MFLSGVISINSLYMDINFLTFFSTAPGNTKRASLYIFLAATIEAKESKSVL